MFGTQHILLITLLSAGSGSSNDPQWYLLLYPALVAVLLLSDGEV